MSTVSLSFVTQEIARLRGRLAILTAESLTSVLATKSTNTESHVTTTNCPARDFFLVEKERCEVLDTLKNLETIRTIANATTMVQLEKNITVPLSNALYTANQSKSELAYLQLLLTRAGVHRKITASRPVSVGYQGSSVEYLDESEYAITKTEVQARIDALQTALTKLNVLINYTNHITMVSI